MKTIVVTALALLIPPALSAAEASDVVRFLVPVAISASGASGTNWKTEVLLYNGSAEMFQITPSISAPPFSTVPLALTTFAASPGVFISIPRIFADNIAANVRVHDTTRDVEGWGVEVPVVPETQFRRSIVLLGVPPDSRFRTLLRVYASSTTPGVVTLTLRDDVTGATLDTRSLPFPAVSDAPAYAQVSLDPIVLALPNKPARVRAEVTTTASAPPLWAFITITNNVTQQVTTITPTPTPSVVTPSMLAVGHWGGNGACMDVSAAQTALSWGCWRAVFQTPDVGADGRFEIEGQLYVLVGPSNGGNGIPAHISGVLQGNSLAVMVATDTGTLGPITVSFGSHDPCVAPCV